MGKFQGWICLILTLVPQAAAQTETQHGFDSGFRIRPRLDLVLHGRIRTRPGALGLYQARFGPVFEYSGRRGLKWIGGYYYTQQENSDDDFIGGHRYFGGAEARVMETGAFRLEMRALAERFEQARNSFARYRFRVRVSGLSRVAPYAGVENFLDANGWRSARYAAGLRVRNGARIAFDFGYFVEPRRADVGRTRHMFMTGLHWSFGTRRRGDPDL